MNIKIIPLYLSFLEGVLKLEEEANPINPWSRKSFLEELSLECSKYYIAVQFEDENQIPDHLEGNEKIAGFIGIHLIEPEGFITNIVVRKKAKNNGVGSLLLERIIQDAKKFRLETISLEVRQSNIPAINLYKKYGFEIVGKRKNYYQIPSEDAIIMTFKI